MLLALAHDLHVKAYGSESLNYRWDGAEQNTTAAAADEKAESTSGSNERVSETLQFLVLCTVASWREFQAQNGCSLRHIFRRYSVGF